MDFTIIIDSREQQPYSFDCSTSVRKLEAGDYSVAGHEHRIAVERKSLPDFVHTVIHDAPRFRNELAKLTECQFACVAVEADLDRVLRGLRQADLRLVTPTAVLGAALHIAVHHRIPVRLKIYTCAMHGECSLQRDSGDPHVKVCAHCPDITPP